MLRLGQAEEAAALCPRGHWEAGTCFRRMLGRAYALVADVYVVARPARTRARKLDELAADSTWKQKQLEPATLAEVYSKLVLLYVEGCHGDHAIDDMKLLPSACVYEVVAAKSAPEPGRRSSTRGCAPSCRQL